MSGLLELLAELHEYAESAAAARLQQMHGHLTTHPKISGYDGTAAQVHQHYAQALAPIVAALRAQAEAEAGPELSENDVVSISDGSMYTRSGEFTSDVFRSSNDVRNGGVPLMTMQVYGPDYDETTDFISFYFERDKAEELHTLLGRFLALPAQADAQDGPQ